MRGHTDRRIAVARSNPTLYIKRRVHQSCRTSDEHIMSEGRLEKSPTASSLHKPVESSSQSSLTYPVRRMRNTAVLVKWIEEHQNNPYPTKAEKQYLAYYSGMNLTQLSTWFANARRRIKKIGMKTWLEGRSTFTVDFFPTPRPAESYGVAGKQPLQTVRCKTSLYARA